MAPTTLVTFRIRAPAGCRTLELFGSWDNFTRGYQMSKDLQTGSQYWSGCFNFSNIICDGRPEEHISRNGGLKMGGTYWYYYKVDGVTDLHNVCERATTNCPLMPGQIVNVLNVPYAISGNRSRNASADSTSSERRTMNPEDRFLNPRPAPAKPDLLRVRTSPVINDFSDNDLTPMRETPNASRFLRLPKKPSVDSNLAVSPASNIADGLRAAFKIRVARSHSPESLDHTHRRAASADRSGRGRNVQRDAERFKIPARGLMLRSASEEAVPTLSFEQRRKQRVEARHNNSPRNGSPNTSRLPPENLILTKSNHATLDVLREEPMSKEPTPIEEEAQVIPDIKIEPDLEKRLPTLPNTPSSAYPPSMIEASPHRGLPLDLEQLNSHFSATTIDTDAGPLSMAFNEQSRFSAWTTSTTNSTMFTDMSAPPLPKMPELYSISQQQDSPLSDVFLPSSTSVASMASSISTTPSTSILDTDTEFEDIPSSANSRGAEYAHDQLQHYSLPEDDYSSQITIKPPQIITEGHPGQPHSGVKQPEIVHSESMQRLLEELSYLSDMIQH